MAGRRILFNLTLPESETIPVNLDAVNPWGKCTDYEPECHEMSGAEIHECARYMPGNGFCPFMD